MTPHGLICGCIVNACTQHEHVVLLGTVKARQILIVVIVVHRGVHSTRASRE